MRLIKERTHNTRHATHFASCLLILASCFSSLELPRAEALDVAPGVTYTEYDLAGPNKVFVVAVDLSHPEYKLEVGWNGKHRNFGSCQANCTSCTGKLQTSQIAAQYDDPAGNHDVIAATNGSYFGCPPDVVGWPIASAGEIVQQPYNLGHPTLAQVETMHFGPNRVPVVEMDITANTGRITFANGNTLTIDQYNAPQAIHTLTAYTPGYDSSTKSTNQGVEVILGNVTYPMRSGKEVSGIVTAVKVGSASLNNTIPAGGMVLNAWGSPATTLYNNSHVGDRLRVRFSTSSEGMNNADMAITGTGWILHNGLANPDGNWSNTLSGTSPFSAQPLTVMAWNNTKFFMVVCEGRGCLGTVGMTFQNMADFLTGTPEIAALEALNFDGGGSSTMWVDGQVKNVPTDSCGTERAVANTILLVKQAPASSTPFSDHFVSTGRKTGWDDKFAYNAVAPFTPTSPDGDGYVLKVIDASEGVNTTRRGDFGDADYGVQADIYCEYRPDVASDGFERYGLFLRDSGTGAFGLSTYGGGNCYAMTCDSDTGRIRAGTYVDGAFTDFLESTPVYRTDSAWHRFRIDCVGSSVTYRLDAAVIASVTDSTHARGFCGLGHQSLFTTTANMHGTRADNFVQFVGSPQPGDMDGDGDVDQEDFGQFQACLSGTTPQTNSNCAPARLAGHTYVDQTDFQIFFNCMSGAGVPANPACAG